MHRLISDIHAVCTRFNPRPPLLAGDAPTVLLAAPIRVFQSAPAIAGGRCPRAQVVKHHAGAFQSAPAIAGGRCEITQSISTILWCFNPRPPLLAGDAIGTKSASSISIVSIRARHCWRAMPQTRARTPWGGRGFNPRPPLLAGDAVSPILTGLPSSWFQSAPAIAGGRCALLDNVIRKITRFNPRPPLLAGDAGEPVKSVIMRLQFQSAPAIAGGRC